MSTAPNIDQSKNIRVRRAAVDSVDLYEVKEDELIQLEKGSDADLYLNFAIFLLSTALSCSLTFATASFKNSLYETFAVVITVVGFFGFALLFLLWLKNKKSKRGVIKQIRDRLPADNLVSGNEPLLDTSKNSSEPINLPETTTPSG